MKSPKARKVSAGSIPTCSIVWVDFVPQSLNHGSGASTHWTHKHRKNKEAAVAWLATVRAFGLRSSVFVGESSMTTISGEVANRSEMPSPDGSDLTMPKA